MRIVSLLAAALACSACVTGPRLDAPPAFSVQTTPIGFPASVRMDALDRASFEAQATDSARRLRESASDSTVDILALSGGGAGGAFGAGVLIGLSRRGERPQYELVTGVSTGALIASFAFLGPEWDAQLTEAYASGASADLMQSYGLNAPFRTALFRGRRCENWSSPSSLMSLLPPWRAKARAAGSYWLRQPISTAKKP